MKYALVYTLEYETARSVNRQQRNTHLFRAIVEPKEDNCDVPTTTGKPL